MEYLRQAARHLADQGRGPDNQLMHVTPNELSALGRLVPGGQLPRNPRTGLPEAGIFESILPAIIGIAATVASGGAAAPVLGGLMSGGTLGALATGATSTALTGDLGKGIASGLMSYGVGSALDGLAQPAADAATQGATNAATSSAPQLGDLFANSASNAAPGPLGQGLGAPGLTSSIGSGSQYGSLAPFQTLGAPPPVDQLAGVSLPSAPMTPDLSSAVTNAPLGATPPPPVPQVMPDPSKVLGGQLSGLEATQPVNTAASAPELSMGDRFQQGLTSTGDRFDAMMNNLKSDPGGSLKRTFIDNAKNTTLPIGIGALSAMQPDPYEPPKEKSNAQILRENPEKFPSAEEVAYRPPPADYDPSEDGEWDYFPGMAAGGGVHGYYAKGGIADANPKAATRANIEAEAKMALIDHHPKAKQALRRYADTFGEEALRDLTEKMSSMGGRIRGAGGGLDDLIPGTIEGRKEVRLADGEFVVPADVVSHLGDGSSDHGVRKLTEMMERIRKSKTGTTKQAGHIKDEKVLPA
jgi:hypothetical protein